VKTRTIIRNVHREPIGQHVDWNELTDECKAELAEFIKETVSDMLVTSDDAQQTPAQQG